MANSIEDKIKEKIKNHFASNNNTSPNSTEKIMGYFGWEENGKESATDRNPVAVPQLVELKPETQTEEKQNFDLSLIRPHLLKQKLDEYVIGNDKAKKKLCAAIYNHVKRIIHNTGGTLNTKSSVIDKSNILLLGGTGSGKTYMLKTLCRYLNIPYHIADASRFTSTGYIGVETDSVLTELYKSAKRNLKQAQHGIIIIDEIDKTRSQGDAAANRSIGGHNVQSELLKMIEGTVMTIYPDMDRDKFRTFNRGASIEFDTSNVLFICMGAFGGLEKIIESRLGTKKMGFSNQSETLKYDEDSIMDYVTPQDLTKYGMMREFVGRLSVITATESLSVESLKEIITTAKDNILLQFQDLFAMDGWKLEFDEGALNAVAEYSIKEKTGARGLRNTMEKILDDYMFDIPGSSNNSKNNILTVTEEFVRKKLEM
jgi:ATP-dependent Clp protease ATP-binding subunit ClpX